MVAAELSPPACERTSEHHRRWLAPGLLVAWSHAYAAIWILTLLSAVLVAVVGRALIAPVRQLLGLTLTAQHNPPPSIGHVLLLTVHNIPITAWPLLLGIIVAHDNRGARIAADTLLVVCVLANVLQVSIAIGAYGTQLLPYIPQLPLEWAGLALGISAWLLQRTHPITVREGLGLLAMIAVVLLCAAILETFAVPHRSTAHRLQSASMGCLATDRPCIDSDRDARNYRLSRTFV